MKTNDLTERLKKSLSKPAPSVLSEQTSAGKSATGLQREVKVALKRNNDGLAKPVTITLFPQDLVRISKYRSKRAGEGEMLNVSEVIREVLRKSI